MIFLKNVSEYLLIGFEYLELQPELGRTVIKSLHNI